MITKAEISRVCQASLEIERCINDTDFLCEKLNRLDSSFLKSFYKSDKEGPINSLRKELCKILLLDDINSEKLENLVESARLEKPEAFKSWKNNYRIFNNLINSDYRDVDDIMIKFRDEILLRIGDVNHKIWDFGGAQNAGQSNYCLAFYNKEQKNVSSSLQIFIDFKFENIQYGLWKESTKTYEYEVSVNHEEFNLEDFENFLEEKKYLILEDVVDLNESDQLTYVKAAKIVLSDNENKPMTSNEIWEEISNRKLYVSSGKTPAATLNAILSRNCINTSVKYKSESNIFKRIDGKPVKFVLTNYLPVHVKNGLIENGFLTIDKLIEILHKNNIKINI